VITHDYKGCKAGVQIVSLTVLTTWFEDVLLWSNYDWKLFLTPSMILEVGAVLEKLRIAWVLD